MNARPKITVRQITEGDTEAVIALLTRGFAHRPHGYWSRAMERLKTRKLPGPFPRFGFALTDNNVVKGVLLLIFSKSDQGDIRANVSSWYVAPEYRLFANMLLAQALNIPDVTFMNVSPDPKTLQTIGLQGFKAYVDGTFVAFAALGAPRPGATLSVVAAAEGEDANILQYHAALGCLSYEIRYKGEVFPFVFLPWPPHKSGVRFVQLVYCRSLMEFRMFAGPLGRALLGRGYMFVIMDATAPLPAVAGRYFPGRRVKCFRGPNPPRIGDLTETELVLFGP